MNTRRAAIEIGASRPRRRAASAPLRPRLGIDWQAMIVPGGALLFQAAIAVWFAASLNQRVGELEKGMVAFAPVPTTVARLDERSPQQGAQLDHLVAQQDQLAHRR